MNRNLKKIIAVTMAINAIAMIGPTKSFNILLDTANASRYDDPRLGELKIDDYHIDFDKETFSYKLKLDKDVDQIKVKAKPNDSRYIVWVDGDEAKEDKKYKVDVDVKQGKSIIPIVVKDKDHNLKTEYEIEVIRGDESQGKDLDDDDVYLDNITLSAGNIDFSSTVTKYDVYIKDPVNYLDIKAKPVDTDDSYVSIDDEDVEEDDDYEGTVSLKDGKNKIVIRVENSLKENKVKKYTLNVYNGVEAPKKQDKDENEENKTNNNTNTDNEKSNNEKDTGKYKNQWVNDLGIWVYYGSDGQLLKNQWYNDVNSGKSYFLNENGVMVTGWYSNNGKWYYFDGNGVMLKNTTIDGYKLGSSGAMV